MNDVVVDRPPAAAQATRSERVGLAQAAREAALAVPGVAGTDSGPTGLFTTAGGGQRIAGVTCVAAVDGGYDVALRLRCELVDLPALGERVKLVVRHAAARNGLVVSDLRVDIVDVVDPGQA